MSTKWQIVMKFSMNIMPREATSPLSSQFPVNNMATVRTTNKEAALTSLDVAFGYIVL